MAGYQLFKRVLINVHFVVALDDYTVHVTPRSLQVQSGNYNERIGYMGAIDDNEPIYDRLIMTLPSKSQSQSPPLRTRSPSMGGVRAKGDDNVGYTRVNRKMKPSRESVMPFANQFKSDSHFSEPQIMDYSVEEYSPGVRARISSSTKLSEHKSHTASLLSDKYPNRRAAAATQSTRKPSVNSPGVNELSKRFSFGTPPPNAGTVPNGRPASKIPTANTPLKATTSASEMTKSPNTLPVKQTKRVNKYEAEVKLRNGISSSKIRPNSWDFTSVMENKVEDVFVTKDDLTPHSKADIEAAENFHRNSNIRVAFRRKSSSREMSPEPDEMYQEYEQNPQHPESSKLSQGSNNSQNSGPPMSVRERTQKWESRGGGLPSYFFSTLPKGFRHKATDSTPSPTSSLNSRTSPRRTLGNSMEYVSTGIPQPTQRSSHSSVSSESKKKKSPSREDADGSSNPDDSLESKNRRQRKTKVVSVTVKTNKRNSQELTRVRTRNYCTMSCMHVHAAMCIYIL